MSPWFFFALMERHHKRTQDEEVVDGRDDRREYGGDHGMYKRFVERSEAEPANCNLV